MIGILNIFFLWLIHELIEETQEYLEKVRNDYGKWFNVDSLIDYKDTNERQEKEESDDENKDDDENCCTCKISWICCYRLKPCNRKDKVVNEPKEEPPNNPGKKICSAAAIFRSHHSQELNKDEVKNGKYDIGMCSEFEIM